MEAEYMADVARQRRPILMCVFVFDIAIYLFRLGFYGVKSAHQDFVGRATTIMPQMINMIALHSIVGWVNWRSRRLGSDATREVGLVLIDTGDPGELKGAGLSRFLVAGLKDYLG